MSVNVCAGGSLSLLIVGGAVRDANRQHSVRGSMFRTVCACTANRHQQRAVLGATIHSPGPLEDSPLQGLLRIQALVVPLIHVTMGRN